MKFMLMMNAPRGNGDYGVAKWSQEDFEAHIEFMHRFNAELKAAGELAAAEGLAAPKEARIVRAGSHGEPLVFPFPFSLFHPRRRLRRCG